VAYCKDALANFLRGTLCALRADFQETQDSIIKINASKQFCTLCNILESAGVKQAESIDEQKAELQAIVDTDEAVQIFFAFNRLDRNRGLEAKALAFVTGEAEDLSNDVQIDIGAIVADHKNLQMKNMDDLSLKKAGNTLGNLTAVQGILRPLEPGETRPQLAAKIMSGSQKSQYLSVAPAIEVILNKLAHGV